MSGHSKWSTIKHKKGALDAKRGKLFTRIIREITMASKGGSGDPDLNPVLRLAIQNAKGANMPKDTIERAIKKGQGSDAEHYDEVTFEGYAPHGIAVFIEGTTDNNNRTVANVRSVFTKFNGSLGTNGSLEFMFDRKGVFTIETEKVEMSQENFEMELIDGGLNELEKEEGIYLVYTSFADFGIMQKHLETLGIEPQNSELQRIPNNTKILNIEDSKSVLKMIDRFEEEEDIANVYHNLELTDELMAYQVKNI